MSSVVTQADALPAQVWRPMAERHRQRAQALVGAAIQRRSRGQYHPVEDFLFDYYNLRPGQLLTWYPGIGRSLLDAEEFLAKRYYLRRNGAVEVDVLAVAQQRGKTIEWMHKLLTATAGRPAYFGCFGLHEWAMVYRLQPEQTRHPQLPLRFDPDRIAAIVDASDLRCSHFDAFRFFTPEAAPANSWQLVREDQPLRDQPGCLHANMDLYKWASKLMPLTPPELLLDCFELARDIRVVDMRASAYDLSGWGYPPIPVETASGKSDYVALQREFAARARPLRAQLLMLLDRIDDAVSAT